MANLRATTKFGEERKMGEVFVVTCRILKTYRS